MKSDVGETMVKWLCEFVIGQKKNLEIGTYWKLKTICEIMLLLDICIVRIFIYFVWRKLVGDRL